MTRDVKIGMNDQKPRHMNEVSRRAAKKWKGTFPDKATLFSLKVRGNVHDNFNVVQVWNWYDQWRLEL